MAILQKISKKAGCLTIVIGAGLLAFILEEGVRASSSFFNDTTAAKVDNMTIDYQEFSNRYAEITQQNNQNNQDAAVLQQSLLQQMATEAIVARECEANDITVTNEELGLLIDNNQQAQSWAQQYVEATGQKLQRASDLDKLMNTDQRLAPIAAQWMAMKREYATQLSAQKVMMLVQGCIVPNDIDIEQMKEEQENSYDVEFASKLYATVDDAKFKPSEAEIKAVYDEYKNMFKINEEVRSIYYIAAPLKPSAADTKEGVALVEKAYAALQGADGETAIRNISEFSSFNENKYTEDMLKKIGEQMGDSAFSKWALGATAGATYKYNKDLDYALFKMKSVDMLTDTAKVAFVSVQGDKAAQDKVLAALNAGQDVSKMKGVKIEKEQSIPVQAPNITDEIKNKVDSASSQYIVFQADPKQGAVFMKTNSTTQAKFYTLGSVSYSILPSTKTSNSAQDKLQAYLNKNKAVAQFKDAKNAQKAGYTVQQEMISSSTAQLGANPQYGMPGITNSRKAIKWAMTEAEKGQVSNIFQDNKDYLIAVAVEDVYDGEYMTLTNPSVKQWCTTKAMNKKKAESLKKEYASCKTLADYAQKMSAGKIDTTQVTFGANMVPNMQGEAGIIGAITASKQGQVKFFAGENGVYAYEVKKVNKNNMTFKWEQLRAQWMQKWGVNQQNAMGIIAGAAKVKNNLAKFQ